MALFTPSTGTLKSVTLENALFEAISLLLQKEKDTTVNTGNENRVTFSLDQNLSLTGTCTFNAIESVSSSDGSINWLVANYLNATFTFTPGTSGTLKSVNLPAAIIEIAKRIQLLEVQTAKNTQNLNKINLVYDSDAATVTLTFQCDLTITIASDGKVQYSAIAYLTD